MKRGVNINIDEIVNKHYGITVSIYSIIRRKVLNEYYIISSSENKKYFVKRYPEKEKCLLCECNFINLANMTEYLISKDVNTPRMIKSVDGKHYVKEGKFWYILFEYLTLDDCSSDSNASWLGNYVSHLHSILKEANIKPFDSWMFSIHDYKEIIKIIYCFDSYVVNKKIKKFPEEDFYLLIRNTILGFIELFEGFIETVDAISEKQFIHGDLNPENIILMRNGITLIDLDSVHYGSVLEDYATISTYILKSNDKVISERQKERYYQFRQNYYQRELFSSNMIYQGMILELIKNMANIVTNWRLIVRFEVARKVLLYIMKQIILFADNQEVLEELL